VPEDYQGGTSWDSPNDRLTNSKGQLLQKYLNRNKPASVLEVGPGSGYLTRLICEQDCVSRYIGIDINGEFLEFLRPRLEELKQRKPGFSYDLVETDFQQLTTEPVEAVIMLAAVHHIPNRKHLFQWVDQQLLAGGGVFVHDASHYLPRWMKLLKKYMQTYRKAAYRSVQANFSTHHMCTIGEYQAIQRDNPGLFIENCWYSRLEFPRFIRKLATRLVARTGAREAPEGGYVVGGQRNPLRFFSNLIAVEFRKNP
jgi:protein-L-isoaspartate O-methyltransferase